MLQSGLQYSFSFCTSSKHLAIYDGIQPKEFELYGALHRKAVNCANRIRALYYMHGQQVVAPHINKWDGHFTHIDECKPEVFQQRVSSRPNTPHFMHLYLLYITITHLHQERSLNVRLITMRTCARTSMLSTFYIEHLS